MIAKCTPGGWRIESQSAAGEAFIVAGDEPTWNVAMTYDFGDNGAESLANARLIAAAPDLLEHMGQMVTALQLAYARLRGHDQGEYSGFPQTLERAREIIAKAEGRDFVPAEIAKATGAA